MPSHRDPLAPYVTGEAGRRGAALVALGFTLVAAAPILAIAHPAMALPVAITPIALIFAARFPIWLALGFVAFSFFRLHETFPVLMPFRIPQLLAAPTLAVLAWHLGVTKSIEPFWSRELTAFAVFFALVTIGLPFASSPDIAIDYWTSAYVKIGLMTIAIAWLVRTPRDFALTARVIVAAGVAVAIVAIQNKLAGIGLVEGTRVTIGRDIGSVLGDPNDLSLVLTFPLSFAVAMATTPSSKFAALTGAAASTVIVWAVLATQSRGGILGILAVFAVTGFRVIKSKALLAGLGGGAALALFAAAGISGRSSGGAAEAGIDESAQGRLWAWEAAFNMAAARPLSGVGLDNFIPNFWAYTPHWTGYNKAVHSTWFGVLAETGWPGLFAFLAMIVVTILTARKAAAGLRENGASPPVRIVANAILSGLAAFCGSGTFLTQGFTWPVYILLALTAAVSHFSEQVRRGDQLRTQQANLPNHVHERASP